MKHEKVVYNIEITINTYNVVLLRMKQTVTAKLT